MSLIILLGYLIASPSHAAPLPLSGSNRAPTGTLTEEGPDGGDGSRELFLTSTLTSCLFTILLSLWVSVHPNAPSPRDTAKKRIWRRIELVLWALLVPELMLCWAVRQYFGAKRLKERYQGQSLLWK
jgi:hypothetical protein